LRENEKLRGTVFLEGALEGGRVQTKGLSKKNVKRELTNPERGSKASVSKSKKHRKRGKYDAARNRGRHEFQ